MATTVVVHDAITEGWEGNVQPYALQPEPLIHGARLRRMVKEAVIDMTGGAGTVTATSFIPAGAYNVQFTMRVTTVIVGAGAASMIIGDGTDTDIFGATIAFAAGTLVTPASGTAAPSRYASAANLVFTANAGQFDTGVVRVVMFYNLATAPTS